jgi:hypothetical protein
MYGRRLPCSGQENGKVFSNHLAGFRRLHSVDRSDLIWLPERITAFMKVAPIELQRALILALHAGQRQGRPVTAHMDN